MQAWLLVIACVVTFRCSNGLNAGLMIAEKTQMPSTWMIWNYSSLGNVSVLET
jgi:hypothetical protein